MKVACNGPGCSELRVNWSEPDTPRGVQMVEVPDGHGGKAYCSLTCAILDGAMRINSCKEEIPRMSETPVLVHKYGQQTWCLPQADQLRTTDCLCRNCDHLKPGSIDNCSFAERLYRVCKDGGIATFITRCAQWTPNTAGTGSE